MKAKQSQFGLARRQRQHRSQPSALYPLKPLRALLPVMCFNEIIIRATPTLNAFSLFVVRSFVLLFALGCGHNLAG